MITNEQKLIFQQMAITQLNIELIHACFLEDLDIVKYLLSSPELTEHADIHAKDDHALRVSCCYGHLDIVKYLLTSSELTEHADIHANNNNALQSACSGGHLDIVKYLLTSTELKEHANIHAGDNMPLRMACSYDHLHILKYLLMLSDSIENTNKDYILKDACKYYRMEIIQYLIFDYNIEKTNSIDNYLLDNHKQDINKMFVTRELEGKLQKGLPNNTTNINSINKIKL